MRRKIILVTFGLLVLLQFAPVAALTSQGFDWTVEVGDQYHYNVLYWEEEVYYHEDMYVNITSNHLAVPDPLTDWWDIPEPPAELYYSNGTTPIGTIGLVFIYAMKLVVPIGNWTLLTELVENVTYWDFFGGPVENMSVIEDTWLHWGYTYNLTEDDDTIMCNCTYLKSNGVLARHHLIAYNETNDLIWGEIEILCDGVPPVVENPSDITYELGEMGQNIVWNATDMSPGGYMILKDDIEISHGFWNSSSEFVTVNVDGLSVGSYNYTIVFYEASGISTSDTVMVYVSAPETTPTSPTSTTTTTTSTSTLPTTGGIDIIDFLSENILIIGIGGGVILLVIVIILLKKR